MTSVIKYVDGMCKTTCEIYDIVKNSVGPVVFTNTIVNWPAMKWSLDEFTKLFGDVVTRFKLYHRTSSPPKSKKCKNELDKKSVPIMETDCIFVNASFKEFSEWMKSADSGSNEKNFGELQNYPYEHFWCYADYKYMAELFMGYPSALASVDWGCFGFPDKNGFESTIWVSSEEACTPCHQDTYGTNLVAQIHGTKRWILYPPEEASSLKPSRIPYEESSVFSQVDPKTINTHCEKYEVDLKRGDVLFVPKHWWHYVESITPSISINTWLEHKTDSIDRLKESLVNMLVYSIKTTEAEPVSKWLNPTQNLSPSFDSCLELVHKAMGENISKGGACVSKDHLENVFNTNFIVNCFTDNEVVDKMVDVIIRNAKM